MNKESFCRILGLPEESTINEIIDSLRVYLRKSRQDMDYYKDEPLEKTLERHLTIIQNWITGILGVPIPDDKIHIIKEVVSGDTIADRPGMVELLEEIENSTIKGVICIETERLARGNTIDQGIIAQTFQLTQTKILTPQKIYDLDNEYDLSFFEDGLRRARDYLIYVKRVLLRGKKGSVNEGKYPFSVAAYGYKRKKLENEKGYTIEFNESEYKIERLIIDLFLQGLNTTYTLKENDNLQSIRETFGITNEIITSNNPDLIFETNKTINIVIDNMGTSRIAKYLNYLGIKPRSGKLWTSAMIKNILDNKTKYGIVTWGKRKTVKKLVNKKIEKSRPISNDYIEVKGNFPAIATMEEKEKIEYKLKHNNSSCKASPIISSPLVGLVKCELCGHNMFKKKSNQKAAIVQKRKYEVDKEKLTILLRNHKDKSKLSINDIARNTHTTRDIISHIFRPDYNKSTIPSPELWIKLKELLNIQNAEFDKSILTYETISNQIIANSLICKNPYCKNIGSDLDLVEKEVINGLKVAYKDYNIFINNYEKEALEEEKQKEYTYDIINNEIDKINKQLDKACELVEDGTYTKQKYIERTTILNNKLKELNDKKRDLSSKNNTLKKVQSRKKAIPIIENVLDNYNDNLTNEEKNKLLKSIIDKIIYKKDEKHSKFSLKIILKY